MVTPKEILAHMPAGRVLDVATGGGGFIHFLLDGLSSYTEIIGIDTNPRGEVAFTNAFQEKPSIHFQHMDALHMTFESGAFDLVCIANSLHHFAEPSLVLQEMQRVLRPGGYFLVNEMYRDNQAETQLTHVHLHHWWAEIDRANGVVHNETYQRQAIIRLIEDLSLSDIQVYDLADTSDDPRSAELISELNTIIDSSIQRAEGHPELQARGEQLRQRVADTGFHSATSLLILGVKHDRGY